jgi:hypothetical protein
MRISTEPEVRDEVRTADLVAHPRHRTEIGTDTPSSSGASYVMRANRKVTGR